MVCALKNTVARYTIYPSNKKEKRDLILFLESSKKQTKRYLKKHLKKIKSIKWYLTLNVRFVKASTLDDAIKQEAFFSNKCIITLNKSSINDQISNAHAYILRRFGEWIKESSGWTLDENIKIDVSIAKYNPLRGKSYFKLPLSLERKKALINVKNKDDYCFLWCVLAALYPVKDHRERIYHYKEHFDKLNIKGIKFPMSISSVEKFELQNKLRINVFSYEKGDTYPLYVSKSKNEKVINLLYLKNKSEQHFCLINKLSRLLRKQGNYCHKRHYCHSCLLNFTSESVLKKHMLYCQEHACQRVELPEYKDRWYSFKNIHKQDKLKFVIYADFESILLKIDGCEPPKDKCSTQKTHLHEPCGFSYYVVCSDDKYSKKPVVYRGKDVIDYFLECMLKEEDEILDVLSIYKKIEMDESDWDNFLNSINCHICGEEIDEDSIRVRDHDHTTGKFRGVAHVKCNLSYRMSRRIPIVIHNLKNYDSHLIMQAVGKVGNYKISCIPNNMEKYLSFTLGKYLTFIDSYQFLSSSLQTLVENLAADGDKTKFKHLLNHVNDIETKLLLRKQVYPYEYIDSWDKFKENKLPPAKYFYSSLTEENISKEDYLHAQVMWNKAKCKTIGDMCDFYVKTDALLLTCVIENFRDLCMQYYGLDPLHYISLPGLTFDACLKFTNAKLELLTQPDMYLFIERGIRGGISVISHRFGEANNPDLKTYDKTKPTSYLAFFDCNGLYSWALSQPLPIRDFQWVNVEDFDIDMINISHDEGVGYILEVDLEYPKELHDKHNLYPLAPEKIKIKKEMLSQYISDLQGVHNIKHDDSSEKLCPNLRDKYRYVIHHSTLRLYLELGLKLKKIHRVLSFHEERWVKPYVDFNTEKRKHAKSKFEQDLFKLMLNSFYGKTMENIRKHVNVELVTNKKRMERLVNKPSFKSFRIFHEDLVAVNLNKIKVKLNKPIYIGFSILDISKNKMYNFHYKQMVEIFGDNVFLLKLTDTDSLFYHIFVKNLEEKIMKNMHLFDTSNYPKSHLLYSDKNKKEIGLFKDEMGGKPIYQYVGLRAKLYSVLTEDDNKRAAKGVNKAVISKRLKHTQYLKSLLQGERYAHYMNTIRSTQHKLYTCKLKKISLCPLDDKRYLLEDGITSLAYGHYKIK